MTRLNVAVLSSAKAPKNESREVIIHLYSHICMSHFYMLYFFSVLVESIVFLSYHF